MNHRGVSPVVGMVLLVGLTSIVAVGILAVGVTITDATSSAAETQQVQSSMEQLADVGERVSDGEANTESFTLAGSDSGTASVDPEAGRLVITHNTSKEKELYNDSLGAYTYETDGTTFAYQGGGVWRAEEHGEPQMVAPPAFEYRSGPPGSQEATLNFPIMRVNGSAAGGEVVDGELSAGERRAVYPSNESHNNPLQGGDVYIHITSEYCEGWKNHVKDRTDGAVVEDCASGNKTGVDELRISLTVKPERTLSAAAVANTSISPSGGGSSHIDGDVVVPGGTDNVHRETDVHGDVYNESVSFDPTPVPEKVGKCSGEFRTTIPDKVNGSNPHVMSDSGTPMYCFTELDKDIPPSSDLTVSPKEDLEVVFQDGMNISGGKATVEVTDDNGQHDVAIYSAGNVSHLNKQIGNPTAPSQTTLHTNKTVTIQGGSTEFFGRIEAPVEYPGTDGSVTVNGASKVVGTVIAPRIHLQGSSTIESHPDMPPVHIGPATSYHPIYYMHLSETELTIAS